MQTLLEAISDAIQEAKKPCADASHTAVCLRIFDDSTFEIVGRCWPNVSYSKFELSSNQKDYYDLVVSDEDYPAKAWPFCLLEFCARYAIRVSNMEVRDWYGRIRPAVWERHTEATQEAEGKEYDRQFAQILESNPDAI